MEPVVLLAVAHLLHLDVRRGDHIVFDPELSSRPMRCRRTGHAITCIELANTGAVLGAIADDLLVPLTQCPPLAALAQAVGHDWTPTPPGPPEAPRPPRLRLL